MKLDAGGLFTLRVVDGAVQVDGDVRSRLYAALVKHLRVQDDGVWLGDRLLDDEPLSPFETRYLADNGHPHPSVRVVATKVFEPRTDLHCHFAGAPRADDLLALAAVHPESIPSVHPERSRGMGRLSGTTPPLSLADADLWRQKWHLPLDRQSTFVDMEAVYRARAPITKAPQLFVPLLWKIAEGYRAAKVQYAELSLGDIHRADRLRLAEEALPIIEAETGVRLRFLLAFSRHNDFEWDEDLIDRVEALAGSRALVGVDFMGHETNSTHAFGRQLQRLSRIAWPGFVARVHAGENPAHPENVRAVLEHVTSRNVCLRIGHGLFGVDDATVDALAERGAFVEFNLNSNFALNNIQTSAEVPLRRYLARGVRCVLSTDGPGLYQTSMKFEVQAARLCGLNDDELDQLARAEDAYLAVDAARPSQKFVVPDDVPPRHYTPAVVEAKRRARTERDAALMQRVGPLLVDDSSRVLEGKRPVSFAGAWLHAWERMPVADRAQIISLLDALMPQLPRDRVVVVTGGTTHGVEGEVLKRAHQLGLPVLATLVKESPPDAIAEGLTHVCLVGEALHDKAAGLYALMQAHDGLCLFLGGGNVVSDEIQVATNLRLRYLLLADVAGASGTHASEQPHRAFREALEVMRRLDDFDFFRAAFEPFWQLGPNPTVDVVVVRGDCEVLLIRRPAEAPAEPNQWALPGGFVPTDAPRGAPWAPGVETPEEAAVRVLRCEAGLEVAGSPLVTVASVEGGGRDVRDTPTAWSCTTLFALQLSGSLAGEALGMNGTKWWPIDALPSRLAFDHARLIKLALRKLYGARHG